jgi:hypothetical protein
MYPRQKMFLFFLVQQQQPKYGKMRAAADGRRGHIITYTARAVDVGRVPARKAQGETR